MNSNFESQSENYFQIDFFLVGLYNTNLEMVFRFDHHDPQRGVLQFEGKIYY